MERARLLELHEPSLGPDVLESRPSRMVARPLLRLPHLLGLQHLPETDIWRRRAPEPRLGGVLTCEECKAVADEEAEGRQAHRGDDPYEDEEPLVVYYCPACAEREFGEGLQNPEGA
jgi:hypothetical protein